LEDWFNTIYSTEESSEEVEAVVEDIIEYWQAEVADFIPPPADVELISSAPIYLE
jgi:hypothetical protein